ncbi:MAG TPA: hypothetical protein VFT64_02035 [Rickettsiales bacterium]|nr:hypothetical protein [Rickettsiales bacterium]
MPSWAYSEQNLAEIRRNYNASTAELEKHLIEGQWIDEEPDSSILLTKHRYLAEEWIVAWLNAHPSQGIEGIRKAITTLAPSETPQCVTLEDDTFLVATPALIPSIFIIAKSDGRFKSVWSITDPQEVKGKAADMLSAWQAGNAVHGGRGPYSAGGGSMGPLFPELGILPADKNGHARFYIDATYAQSAGGTQGKQITLWAWDGTNAHLQFARNYLIGIDQDAGTRVEGNLLKVQQKKSFRTFFMSASSPERQVDWIVQIEPEGMKEVGEEVVVPELDAVDELFYRLIKGTPASDIASPAAIKVAEKIIQNVRAGDSEEEWKKYSSLGMIMDWAVTHDAGKKSLCLPLDEGTYQITFGGKRYFIASLVKTNGCKSQ